MAHYKYQKHREWVIIAVLVLFMTLLFSWSLHESEKFSCKEGSHQLQSYDTLNGVALKFCDGNIMNAQEYIRVINNIPQSEIGRIPVNKLIVVHKTDS